jgi:hypothetical protein
LNAPLQGRREPEPVQKSGFSRRKEDIQAP